MADTNNQNSFLDYAGLALFWNNIKKIINDNELVTATAITVLDTRVDQLEKNAVDLTSEQTITAKKTFSGGINLNGTTINKLGSPVNTDDAANKEYVDDFSSIPFTNPVGEWCPDPCFWKGDDGYFYIYKDIKSIYGRCN